MPDLAAAQTSITDWWATKTAFVNSRGGYRARRGLVNQIQREAVAKAHEIAGINSLSDADADALVAFALQTAKVPEW